MEQTIVLKLDPQDRKLWENIERMVGQLLDKQEEKKPENDDVYYTGPEILRFYKCGREKLKQMVAAGEVERDNSFGKNPRYRRLRKEAAR